MAKDHNKAHFWSALEHCDALASLVPWAQVATRKYATAHVVQ